jgi:DNA-directed RNA polymerase specialized sigma24 family protein
MLEQIIADPPAPSLPIWHSLPDDEREVLWLTCELGLSYEEAAKAMGISVEAARACLLRARLQFMPAQD